MAATTPYHVTFRRCGTDAAHTFALTQDQFMTATQYYGMSKYKLHFQLPQPLPVTTHETSVELFYKDKCVCLAALNTYLDEPDFFTKHANFSLNVKGGLITTVIVNVSDWLSMSSVYNLWKLNRDSMLQVEEANRKVYKEVVKKRCAPLKREVTRLRRKLGELEKQKTAIKADLKSILDSTTPVNSKDFM